LNTQFKGEFLKKKFLLKIKGEPSNWASQGILLSKVVIVSHDTVFTGDIFLPKKLQKQKNIKSMKALQSLLWDVGL